MITLRFASAFAALLALSLLPIPVESAKVDFDKGVDSSQILTEARSKVPLSKIDKAGVQRAAATQAPTKGPVIGMDLRERVTGSEPYQTALQYPPLIENLKPEVRDPLKAEWRGINTTRTELLSEAAGLETEDTALANRAAVLDQNAQRLNQRTAQLDAEVDNFNRQCTGRPLPPDQYNACVRWRDDLQRRINAHNSEVDQHNAAVEKWRNDATDLRRRAGTTAKGRGKLAVSFLGRVSGWEQRVILFSNAAKRALEENPGCGRLAGLKIVPIAPPDLPTSSKQPFTAIPSFDEPQDKPCPVTYLWSTRNTTGNIGSLQVDPRRQEQATLNTGKSAATGFVIIEVDEAIGKKKFRAEAHVTVTDLEREVCGLLPNQSHPVVKNMCAYQCTGDSQVVGPLDQYGEPDPQNPGQLKCMGTILKPRT